MHRNATRDVRQARAAAAGERIELETREKSG
jgi:hypothetical protein